MKIININLKKCKYKINITDCLSNKLLLSNLKNFNKFMIVTDTNVSKLHLDSLLNKLKFLKIKADYLILPNGEKYKSLKTLNLIFDELLKKFHNRKTTLISLGGGVICDLVGFAASSYLRGVNLIHIPTTLLAQIDASIGGKTGVNHILGKNMIGSFYHPSSILINVKYLYTLPKREFFSGLAEIIKYSIVLDKNLFTWLELNINNLISLKNEYLLNCIYRCCEIKSKIVILDENEINNVRTVLNFGHTYGHAIESYMKYSKWTHGECVSVGIVMAMYSANLINNFSILNIKKVKNLLIRAGLPTYPPQNMSIKSYLKYMYRDKKNTSNKIKLILPKSIGSYEIKDIEEDIIVQTINNSKYL
ncbi:MAG: 3-dehydroquinate synthase [Enterobacterales bacterium]